MRRTILSSMVALVAFLGLGMAIPGEAQATTQAGIWWSSPQYPGGIGQQVQYQVIYNGATEWVRVVGFHEWITYGCFANAGVSEYDQYGTRRGGWLNYGYAGSPCIRSVTTDATSGHAYTTDQMPWMEVPAGTAGRHHGGTSGVTSTTSGSANFVIGG
jgi:hypothetical protein